MKRLVVLVTMLFALLFGLASTDVLAVPRGKSITFPRSSNGKVIFDGTVHNNSAKKGCRQCHNPQLFPRMKQGTVHIIMKNIYAGEQCGSCHNGHQAFKARSNCGRCHKK
ncbi:MAG: cytochrome C [Desulfobacteraceae bacterium 4572_35.1]|nr:MAG: cytochrome C [Desulfobacteraceae bacterium 4572_35.1]